MVVGVTLLFTESGAASDGNSQNRKIAGSHRAPYHVAAGPTFRLWSAFYGDDANDSIMLQSAGRNAVRDGHSVPAGNLLQPFFNGSHELHSRQCAGILLPVELDGGS